MKLHSNDGSVDFVHSQLPFMKSPTLPTVPNNSYASNQNIPHKHTSQGLYSALEALALSNSKNEKELNSLSQSKKN
eukprot:UN13569